MNTIDNKRMLWDFICEKKVFREGMKREVAIQLFEDTIASIDRSEEPVSTKNKMFIDAYIKNMDEIIISEADMEEHRQTFFEERILTKQQDKSIPMHNIFDPIDVHAELVHIKTLLREILDKLK
jgi:hypothetical protein